MNATLTSNGHSYEIDLARPISIAIDLDFQGDQPSFFGAPPASARPLSAGNFVGATAQGGSCNVDQLQLTPHCNGTHTECARHLTSNTPPITDVLVDAFILCNLVTVEALADDRDLRVTEAGLRAGLQKENATNLDGLIIRTSTVSPYRNYVNPETTPYLAADAIHHCVTSGVKHLLIDLPSIDRMDDQQLTNHRIFFDGGGGVHNTITELIHVPAAVPDGLYVLNLQIAPLVSDASPSRPIIFQARRV